MAKQNQQQQQQFLFVKNAIYMRNATHWIRGKGKSNKQQMGEQ